MRENDIFGLYTEGELQADLKNAGAALNDGDLTAARFFAERAYRHRMLRPEIWRLLAIIYDGLGEDVLAVRFAVVYGHHGGETALGSIPPLKIDYTKNLDMVYTALMPMYSAPIYKFPRSDGEWGATVLCGRFLPGVEPPGEKLWCGVYNPHNIGNAAAFRLAHLAKNADVPNLYSGLYFDFMKAQTTKNVNFALSPDEEAVFAVAGVEDNQKFCLTDGQEEKLAIQGQYEFNFYRTKGAVQVYSNHEFAVSAPIILKHSPRRLKLILHILVDALSWGQMKKENYDAVPNLIKFFGDGVIFDNNYAAAEHTYPSVASLMTGMYPHRTQMLVEGIYAELPREYITLPEQIKNQGYYCAAVANMSNDLGNRVDRGFDRLINSQYYQPVADVLDRTVAHLDAFGECDNFVKCHIFDAHLNFSIFPVSLQTQVKLPWYESISNSLEPSLRQPKTPRNVYENHVAIARIDRYLGILFDYLQKKYREDEYLVCLYSDHGVSCYNDEIYYLSEEQNCAAMMLRGAGVPKLGVVKELTSNLDLYPMMEKLLGFKAPSGQLDGNLPACLGGQERKYVISQSIYPNQTYKLCWRNQKYECRLESDAMVRPDCTVDLSNCQLNIFTRDAEHKLIRNPVLAKQIGEIVAKHTASFNVPE